MAILTEKILEEILIYLEKVMNNLAKESFENLELEEPQQVKIFLQNQFDIRLENLLAGKNSNIHHLESGMKNKIIQQKQEMISKISKQYDI